MPEISIIVAVYKAEDYIRRCIESILSQTFKDFELLFVDDGSPDKSGEICEEYAQKDDRVRVFHKPNGGVSHTRQYALERARGKYVIHADPDDYSEPTMYEKLYNKAIEEDSDMVICDFFNETIYGNFYMLQRPTSLSANDVLHDLLSGKIWGTVTNKLIKKECFEKYNVTFPKDINLWEDLFVCCSLLRNNIKVSYINEILYHYDNITNQTSMVRKITLKSVQDQDAFIRHFSDIMTEEELYFRKENTLLRAFAGRVMSAEEFRNFYPEINSLYIQKHKRDFKHIEPFLLAMLLKGTNEKLIYTLYDITERLVFLYRKIRKIMGGGENRIS